MRAIRGLARQSWRSPSKESGGPTEQASKRRCGNGSSRSPTRTNGAASRMPKSVSRHPEDWDRSLSFGGQAFFVVGPASNASRPARRFPRPAPGRPGDQFQRLRIEVVTNGCARQSSSVTSSCWRRQPMPARHGEASEARHILNWIVGDEWGRPFRDPRANPAWSRSRWRSGTPFRCEGQTPEVIDPQGSQVSTCRPSTWLRCARRS